MEKLKSEIFDLIVEQDILKIKYADLEKKKLQKLEELKNLRDQIRVDDLDFGDAQPISKKKKSKYGAVTAQFEEEMEGLQITPIGDRTLKVGKENRFNEKIQRDGYGDRVSYN